MTVLTPAQTYAYAVNAGFTGPAAVIATAIAGAESSYNTASVGDVNLTTQGEQSVGLWQINYRPARDANDPYRNPVANLDPAANAAAAYAKSGGGKNWRPWSTFTSGAYVKHMPEALAAAYAAGDNPTLPAGVSTGTASAGANTSAGSSPFIGVKDPGLNLNPFDGFGIAQSASAGIANSFIRIIIPTVFVVGGVALVGAGLFKAATGKGVRQTGSQLLPSIPPAAAAAAL